jgi:NhaA family Na+:H+ antiporter
LFAFCNSAVHILPEYFSNILSPLGLGIILGLFVGKTIGIFSFSFIATKIGISKLPDFVDWKQIFGVSILGGVGFTMSIFVTLLAFKSPEIIEEAKLFIMISSASAAIVGLLYLRAVTKPTEITKAV